jgi:putative flavoprotein involved in K+ transport
MGNPASHILDVIVIGAGHAGLSTSYFLSENKISHIVLERGQVGESWRSQRWDFFTLNTPNHMNRLPGERNPNSNPEGFLLRDEVVAKLKNYAGSYWDYTSSGFPGSVVVKSGILYGITDDAAFIVSEIMKYQS